LRFTSWSWRYFAIKAQPRRKRSIFLHGGDMFFDFSKRRKVMNYTITKISDLKAREVFWRNSFHSAVRMGLLNAAKDARKRMWEARKSRMQLENINGIGVK
jgi:hypothetical protein